MVSVVVIGSGGRLGADMVETLEKADGYRVCALSHSEIECTDEMAVRKTLTEIRPEVVVNCAAFGRVDKCEESPDRAFSVNSLGAHFTSLEPALRSMRSAVTSALTIFLMATRTQRIRRKTQRLRLTCTEPRN